MTPTEAASAAAVARKVRAEILSGKYDEKGRAPSRADLKREQGISLENASVVLRMLAAEGWVTLEQGRGSFLRPRRLFDVWVEVPRPDIRVVDRTALWESADAGAGDEDAVKVVRSVRVDDEAVRVTVAVTATSAAMAALIGEALVRSAPGWSWDGWDLAGASVTARPA
jgi:DNA-binding transcriptional regulator YhcF (GntR family)